MGASPFLRDALGLGLEHGSGGVAHFLVETVPGRPGTPKQVVREGSTLRFRLERMQGISTLPEFALENTNGA